MYFNPDDQVSVEEICYESSHINEVLKEIRKNLPEYVQKYYETEGGTVATDAVVNDLAAKFGSSSKPKAKTKDVAKILKALQAEAIDNFERDREDYQEILDLEALEEYALDVPSFKNKVLRDMIPIIRKTLQNKAAKELDKFRAKFNLAQPGDLFSAVNNIIGLAEDWKRTWYEPRTFEKLNNYEDLDYDELDEEKYVVYGVIGGGIKSQLIYKLHPEMYPSRSREAVWALYYLTKKKTFGCREESEFIMINADEGTTQQNYFYPYGLFSYYALQIYYELKKILAQYDITIDIAYRFVIVDAFLSFVARQHQNEINLLKQSSENLHYDY